MKFRIASPDEIPKAPALLAVLLVLSLLIRGVGLDIYPPGLNSDELLKAYDGASVIRHGIDHHGESWPLFFRQSGEYSPPLYIYTTGMITGFFGINECTTRIPSTLFGTASVFLTFLLVRQRWGVTTGFWAAFLVMVSPWCVQYSRIGWEAISLVPLQLAGVYFLWRWKQQNRMSHIVLAALFWGATVYAYPTARLTTPLMLFAFLVLNYTWIKDRLLQVSLGAVTLIIIWVPFLWALSTNHEAMQARWQFVSIFRRDDWLWLFVSGYMQHISPVFLFWSGDISPMHNLLGGQALLVLLPFVLTGLYAVLHTRSPEGLLLIAWFLIMPIAPSLTFDEFDPHSIPSSLRCIGMVPVLEIFAAVGIGHILAGSKKTRRVILSWATGLLVVINAGVVGYDAFVNYPHRSASAWQQGLREAVEYTETRKAHHDRIVFSHTIRLHPVSLATFSDHPVGHLTAQAFHQYVLPFFHYVPVYGEFGHQAYLRQGNRELGSISRWYHLAEGNNLLVALPGEIEAEPDHTIFLPDGSAAYEFFTTRR